MDIPRGIGRYVCGKAAVDEKLYKIQDTWRNVEKRWFDPVTRLKVLSVQYLPTADLNKKLESLVKGGLLRYPEQAWHMEIEKM